MEKTHHDLTDAEEVQLKVLLTQLFETGGLHRSSVVTYSEEEQCITEIIHLLYDKESKTYTFKRVEKQVKSSDKSKSNIDRHLSRSKENKR
jgi:hypothetical protein